MGIKYTSKNKKIRIKIIIILLPLLLLVLLTLITIITPLLRLLSLLSLLIPLSSLLLPLLLLLHPLFYFLYSILLFFTHNESNYSSYNTNDIVGVYQENLAQKTETNIYSIIGYKIFFGNLFSTFIDKSEKVRSRSEIKPR